MAHILCRLIYRLRAVERIEDHIADIWHRPSNPSRTGDRPSLLGRQ